MLTTRTFPDRETWLAARTTLGGSDAPSIMGLTPWASPVSRWAEMTGKVARDNSPAALRLELGLALEPFVLRKLSERRPDNVFGLTPLMIATNDKLPGRHVTPDHSEMGPLSPQFHLVPQGRYGEIKTTAIPDEWGPNEIPKRVLVQVQHMLAVTEQDAAPVSVLILGYRPAFYDYIVPRNEDLISIILDAEEDFLMCVQTDTPPPADGSEATKSALAKMYPVDNGTTIELAGEDWQSWLTRLDAAKEQEKAAKAVIEESKNELRLALAEASYARFPEAHRLIQCKRIEKPSYSVKAQSYREVREVKFR